MSQKTSSVKTSAPADFSWTSEIAFVPPSRKGGTAPARISEVAKVGDLKALLQEYLTTLISVTGASAGIVRIFPPPHGEIPQIISSVGFPAELLEMENTFSVNCESIGKVSAENGIFSADLGACKIRNECRHVGCQIQSMIASPLENPDSPGSRIGVLTLFFDTPREPTPISRTVESFTKLLGAIVEHNKSNCDAMRVELLAERQAIANEIHDTLAQTLVYTRMCTSLLIESLRSGNQLMASKYAHDIDDALEISQKTARELITDFRCAMDPSGLHRALQTLTEQFCVQNDIALEYINRVARLDLPLEYEIQIYHIVQEALANIANHSGATHARLIVDLISDYYVFTVKDNGTGGCTFTPVEGHYGMLIMRERAQRISGEIRLESAKGFGTHVQLFFPKPGSNWRAANE